MKEQSAFEKRVQSIYEKYAGFSLQEKIDVIAQTFGCRTGKLHTFPCYSSKWRGTSDMFIRFDNGEALFIGKRLTPDANKAEVRAECVNGMLARYNPEIVQVTKETALPALLRREAMDNEIAAQKGLKPYKILNVELNTVAEKNGCYLGWYYVTLAVDGKIRTHLETGLCHAIADGKVNDLPTRPDYFTAGALKESDVDYVFNNVGYSSKGDLYTLSLSQGARKRAEETLAKRLEQERVPNPEVRETSETVQTPRGTFHVADMSREDMEAAGYAYHHQSEDGHYLIMSNGIRAFAISSEVAKETPRQEKMTVLVVEPERRPYKKAIEPGLRSLQAEVGGYIEAVYPYEDTVALLVNEEGKIEGLPYNRVLRNEDGKIYDIVAGTFLVVGLGEEDFSSLTPEQISKFEELFQTPDVFVRLESGLAVFPSGDYIALGWDSPERDQEDDLEL